MWHGRLGRADGAKTKHGRDGRATPKGLDKSSVMNLYARCINSRKAGYVAR
jgi:hypothetical protein